MSATTPSMTATQDRVLQFYQEVATYAQQANQGRTAQAQGEAQIKLAAADADTSAQTQIKQKLAHIKRVTEVALKLATETANRKDLAGVEELLGEIESRLANYGDIIKSLRAMEAQFELAIAMGEFAEGAPGATRAEVEAQIAAVRGKAEKQLELAAALIPSPSVVLAKSGILSLS